MARTVTTIFNMRENYSSQFKKASASTREFQAKVTAAARVLDLEAKKRREIKVQAQNANKTIAGVRSALDKMKNVRINIAARVQNFKRDMRPVTDSIKGLVRKPLMISLKLKDMALAGLTKIGNLLRTLGRGAMIGVGMAGAGLGFVLSKGATLEQYRASIEHNVFASDRNLSQEQVKKKAKGYSDWLTKFAADTTASVDDIFSGGAHALAGTGGDIKAAQGIVKIAQDMAAQKPGATTWDAVEAILDASRGSFTRINEFGFKMSAEALKAAGGDMFQAKDAYGNTLMQKFQGAEARKAATASGTWDSLVGTIEGGIMRAGENVLIALQPFLQSLDGDANKLADTLAQMGTDVGKWITDFVPKLQEFFNLLKPTFDSVVAWLGEKWAMLEPFRNFIANAFAGVDSDGEKVLGGITGAINQLVDTLISWLNGLAANWDKIEPVIAGIIKFLPQIALAFAGFKVIGWGITTGKAIGNFFGGAGDFFGRLFGKGKSTVPAPASTPKTTPTGKNAGANRNTFTGPNYNTFNGPNNNTGNGHGNNPVNSPSLGSGGGTNILIPPRLPGVGQQPMLPSGPSPLGLPAGSIPFGAGGKIAAGALGGAGTTAMVAGISAAAAALVVPAVVDGVASGKFKEAWTGGSNAIVGTIVGTSVADVAQLQQKMIQNQTSLFGLLQQINSASQNPTPVDVNVHVTAAPGLLASVTGSGRGAISKEAAGIKRVPWDNYPTLLHKGEAVLPAGEAGEYRAAGNRPGGGGGVVLNGGITINGANKDGRQIAAEIVQELQRAMFNLTPEAATV